MGDILHEKLSTTVRIGHGELEREGTESEFSSLEEVELPLILQCPNSLIRRWACGAIEVVRSLCGGYMASARRCRRGERRGRHEGWCRGWREGAQRGSGRHVRHEGARHGGRGAMAHVEALGGVGAREAMPGGAAACGGAPGIDRRWRGGGWRRRGDDWRRHVGNGATTTTAARRKRRVVTASSSDAESDEDIAHNDRDIPHYIILESITRSRARKLHYELHSFLTIHTDMNRDGMLFMGDILILRNHENDDKGLSAGILEQTNQSADEEEREAKPTLNKDLSVGTLELSAGSLEQIDQSADPDHRSAHPNLDSDSDISARTPEQIGQSADPNHRSANLDSDFDISVGTPEQTDQSADPNPDSDSDIDLSADLNSNPDTDPDQQSAYS